MVRKAPLCSSKLFSRPLFFKTQHDAFAAKIRKPFVVELLPRYTWFLTQRVPSSFPGFKKKRLMVMSLIWEKLSLCCQIRHSRLKRLFPSEGKTGKVGQIFSTCRRSQTVSGRRPFVSFHHLSSSAPPPSRTFKNKRLQTYFVHVFLESFWWRREHVQLAGKTHLSKIKHMKVAQQRESSKKCSATSNRGSFWCVKVPRIKLFIYFSWSRTGSVESEAIPERTETREPKAFVQITELPLLPIGWTIRSWIVQIRS